MSAGGMYGSSMPREGVRGSGWGHRLSNALKTTVLLAGLTALLLFVGERLGGIHGAGS